MTKNQFTIKKLTIVLVVALMLLAQNCLALLGIFNFSKKEVFADNSSLTAINISNSNFTSSGSGSLADPSNFTTVGDKKSTISGVIDTDVETFDKKATETYNLDFNPEHPKASKDNKVLMINNQNLKSSFGYKSSSFTLEKNGYYYVSCYVYTQGDDISSTASLYLSNETFDKLSTSKIENISTRGIWKEFRFYIKTNSNDQSLNLVLYIGTKDSFTSYGAVFFDNISAYSLPEKTYYDQINNLKIENSEIVLTNKIVTTSNGILNGDFNDDLSVDFKKVESEAISSKNFAKIVGIGDYFDSNDSKIDTDPTSANRLNNSHAFLINNSTANYTAYKSNDILIKQHKLYKLSVDIKTSNFADGGAKLVLEQKNPFTAEDYENNSKSFSTINTSSQTNSIKNDWITYSFYISGNVFKDCYANLTLALDEKAVGYALFDNIVLEEITTSEYDNNSSSTNSESVDFSNLESPKISNAFFNNITINSTDDSYPYVAKDITVTSSNDSNYSGIINTHSTNFDSNGYEFTNPVSIYNSNADLSYNNVFVLANKSLSYQTATTKTFTLSASTLEETKYYKVSLFVNTQSLLDYGVNVSLKTEDGEVLSNIRNIISNNNWTEVSSYIKMSSNEKVCKLEISLGSKVNNAKGFAFIDNMRLEKVKEEDYNSITTLPTIYKNDLSNNDLSLKSENKTNNIYQSNNFTGTLNSLSGNVEAGVINTSSYPAEFDIGYVKNDNVLLIHNISDAYYSLKSQAYKLIKGNYYKITASVKTMYARQNEENVQKDDNNEIIPFGAKLELMGIDKTISGIVTNNEYETYTFFVNTTADTTLHFNLSLGDEKALTSGYAFFDNLSVSLISEDNFTESKNNKAEDDDKTIIIGDTDKTEDTKSEEDTTNTTNFDWLVLPTLILAVALLIAMIGLLIRKLNIKLPTRQKRVKDYDRATTLVKEVERREKIKQREERLKALREKLIEIQNQIDENKLAYKNNKALKAEIKVQHEKVEKKIRDTFKDITSNEAISAERKLKLEAKQKIKQERKAKYIERRNELISKYLEIEKEIDAILEEERLLVEEWKAYKKQLKLEKLEAKQAKKKNKK